MALLCLLLLALPTALAATPTPPGTLIRMESTLNWQSPAGSITQTLSATTSTTTPVVHARTPSSAAFLAYAPHSPDHVRAGPTYCLSTGTPALLPAPVSPQGATLDPDQPLPLGPAQLYYPDDPTFLKLVDKDQNLNPDKRETVDVTVAVQGSSQSIRLRLIETDVDTGVFVGYAFTTDKTTPTGACTLAVQSGQTLILSYTDPVDPSDHSQAQALISPYDIAFDSSTGEPVNGAQITLVEAQTGQPATVTGRDGFSNFPSTVTSGQSVTDSSGATYQAATGAFLFPEVKAGNYRLKVVPPTGYAYPSGVSTQTLQDLPGAPFTLGDASFGKAFTLSHLRTVGFDIPLDPVSTELFVTKTVSKAVASVGDMLQFTVSVENSDKTLHAADVKLVDTLPQGFRYVPNSARVIRADASSGAANGNTSTTALEPSISDDGQQLTFNLGDIAPSGQVRITYVTVVSAATPLGTAINRAQGLAAGGAESNVATAQVHIRNELMQNVNTVIGRVIVGCKKDGEASQQPLKGLPGVRVLMEDGTWAVTDAEGRYHFPKVTNGTHVVQLDVDSLPPGYAVAACRMNTRFAGRAYSQFVELHGGALWHANFHVRILPPPSGTVNMAFSQQRVSTDVAASAAAAIDTTVNIAVDNVPVKAMSVTVMLPPGSHYENNSAQLNGERMAAPDEMGGALVFRLGDRAGGWHGKLQFRLNLAQNGKRGAAPTTMLLLNFGTPSKASQHAKPVSLTLVARQAKSALQATATRGLSPVDNAKTSAKPVDKPEADGAAGKKKSKGQDKPSRIHLDAAWFAAAGPKPEFVLPTLKTNPSVPAIQVAVKHAPADGVRLSVNNQPISPRNMLGVQTNARKTASVTGWLGVPVVEGNNTLVADITQGDKVIKSIQRKVHYSGPPVRVEIVKAKSQLIADGKTRPRIAIRLFDRWGYPVREGLSGNFTINAPYKSWRVVKNLQDNPLGLTAQASRPSYTVGKDGIAIIELAPTTHSGQVTLDIPLARHTHQELHTWMKPGKRDWILVGLAAGTAAFNQISGHMQSNSGDDPNKDLFQDGRIAFYAKGTIKGEYLLTMAYDTAKKEGLESSDLASLGQQIDPNQYFMLYGDASTLGHDAQSNSKLYIKIERGQFNAMFGLFNTGLTVTKLARYSRRFNGLKSQYQGKNFGYTAFAARNAQSYVKDEIQGNGTSGLYHLSHQLILINSERVELVTRDRFHPDQIISTQPLTRYTDYNIDYTAGTIFFKQPIPSFDENFNPVYIVVSYEVTRSGDEAVTGGGRVSWRSDDNNVEVGVTGVNEGSQLGDNQLGGVDLRVELSKQTELKAEIAHTHNGGAGVNSQLTGFNSSGSVATSNNSDSSARAWRVSLKHQGKNTQGKVYAKQLDPNFGLGQQSLGQVGTRKLGADGIYRVGKHWELRGEVWSEKSLTQATKRNAANATARWHNKGSSITAGLRHVDDDYLKPDTYDDSQQGQNGDSGQFQNGSGSTNQVQLGGSTQFFDGKLRLHGNTSQDISGGGDAAWPSMTTVGADYQVTQNTALFLNQRFTGGSGDAAGGRMTVFGARAKPWDQAQLESSISQQTTEYGPRLFSTTGLTQGWQLNEHVTLNAGLQRSHSLRAPNAATQGGAQQGPGNINPANPPIGGSATEDFTSGFFGAAWNWEDWSATSRIEMLHSDSQQRLGLMGGLFLKLSDGNGVAARLQSFTSRFDDGGRTANINLRLSFAHRPNNGHWAVLNQLDLIFTNRQGLSGSPFLGQGSTGITGDQSSGKTPGELAADQGTPSSWGINQRDKKIVNNLQVNYFGTRSEWSFYLGLKYGTYHFDVGNYNTVTSLVSTEYRYDITPNWDLGFNVSRLTTWRSAVSKNRFGVELGHSFGKNMWVSLGYNFSGFEDRDFSGAGYTSQGLFLRFRMKFDQDTIKNLLGFGD